MNESFEFIGYSIRDTKPVHLPFHKPDTRVLSMDQMLFPLIDIIKKNDENLSLFSILTKTHSEIGIYSSFELIKKLYLECEHKCDLGLFGYAISKNNLSILANVDASNKEITNIGNFTINDRWISEFCGYDVMELDGYISTLLNCDIDWKIAEEFGELNNNNLFSNYLSAFNFAEICIELVPEHSPCAVWAIWKITKKF